jgi:SH3-like domain-containing protein
MSQPSRTVEVPATIIRRTPAALLVRDAEGTEGWVPRSQVSLSEVGTLSGAQAAVEMPVWLARSRGFVGQVAA